METSKLLALKLSALSDHDFNWVYEQLKPEVKDELAPIVKEIREIGFEVDHDDIDALLAKNAVSQPMQDLDVDAQLVANASYQDIRKIFSRETSVLFNTLSDLNAWEWTEDKEFIVRSKSSGGVKISNIESKNRLKKSLITATAKQLRKNNVDNIAEKKSATRMAKASRIFNRVLRRTQ